MVIAIIGAMEVEIEKYVQEMKEFNIFEIADMKFYAGKLKNLKTIVVKSKIGKVNSAICAQILILKFNVSKIFFTGVAGALNENLNIHDIVISKDSMHHDMDVTKLGYEIGQIPESTLQFFEASTDLKELAINCAKELNLNYIEGRILSGDKFVADKTTSKFLREELKGDCVEMEGAAVGHVCQLNNVPHLIIRSISDKANEDSDLDYNEFVKISSEKSYQLISAILEKISKINDNSNLNADSNIFSNTSKFESIKNKIRTIEDFPKKGIQFRDITSLIKDKDGFKDLIELLYKEFLFHKIDVIAGIESRGFVTGAVLANKLEKGFVLIRKKGKLPGKVISEEYDLEYGKDTIEIHEGSILKGQRVLLVDDLIATGGTAIAGCKLIEKCGGIIDSCCFIVDLPDLKGSSKLKELGYNVKSLINFEGD